MRKTYRTALAAVLGLVLALTLSAPAGAADSLTLVCTNRGDGSAVLTVRGLDGARDVYAAQLDLTLEGAYPDLQLTPAQASAFTAVETPQISGGKTRVSLYWCTQDSAMNSGAVLPLGTLDLDGGQPVPSSAVLTLLDWDLSPFQSASGTPVAVLEEIPSSGSGGSSGGSSSGGGSSGGSAQETGTRYTVRVSAGTGGSVKASPSRAERDDRVVLTVAANSGYVLESLSAVDAQGRAVALTAQSGGRYTFRMPDSDVDVTAVFRREAGENPAPSPSPSPAPAPSDPPPFDDVAEGDWFYSAVQYVYQQGLMSGTSPQLFSPDVPTTRGMIVTILHRMEGSPTEGIPNSPGFPDVAPGQYYTEAVAWAASSGVVTGYQSGLFGPDDPITREQFAAILFRYASLKGGDEAALRDLSAFPDQDAVSPYAMEAMIWAVDRGLISGMGDGTLSPGGSATRAQAAAILTRFCESVLLRSGV